MSKIMRLLFYVAVCNAIAHPLLRVDSRDEQCGSDNQTVLRLKIDNKGSLALSNVKVDYYLTLPKDDSLLLDIYYLPAASAKVHRLGEGLWLLEIALDTLPTGEWPNSSGISLGLHLSNWGGFNKSDDYSTPIGCSFVENQKIVVNSNASVIYGHTPGMSTGDLRIVAVRPYSNLGPQEVRIRNVGESPISTFGWSYKTTIKDNAHALPDTLLPVDGDLIIKTENNVESGEFALYSDSMLYSYVAWGDSGSLARQAEKSAVWFSASDYLVTHTDKLVLYKGYRAGSEFWVAPNLGGKQSRDWVLYYPEELSLALQSLPPPAAVIFPLRNTHMLIREQEPIEFSWVPIPGVETVNLQVVDQRKNEIVVDTLTSENSIRLTLAPGDYSWGVGANSEFLTASANGFSIGSIEQFEPQSPSSSYQLLGLESPKARRDTRMLDLGWGNQIMERKWDAKHHSDSLIDNEEWGRCWIVTMQIMNHFYGGTITQDELKYYGKATSYGIKSLLAFPQLSGGVDGEINKTLAWSLGIKQTDLEIVNQQTVGIYAFVERIIKEVKNGRPVLVQYRVPGLGGHAEVVDGFLYTGDNIESVYLHFLNVNNDGYTGWQSPFEGPYIYENGYYEYLRVPKEGITVNARQTDPLLLLDSDKDDITDFDEINRFLTSPNRVDTDGDGIPDKREIESCAFQYPYMNKTVVLDCDPDNDGHFGWDDMDSDGGGAMDNYEDLDWDGRVAANETNPWISFDDNGGEVDAFGSFDLYALNRLWLNDGAVCAHLGRAECKDDSGIIPDCPYVERSLCRFASGNRSLNGEFSSTLGWNVTVELLSSLGDVFLRNKSIVEGLRIGDNAHVIAQKDASYSSAKNASYNLNNYPDDFRLTNFTSGTERVLIKAGEVYRITPGHYASVTVNSGGTIVWPDGELFVGELQMEYGAISNKQSLDGTTILHLNGKCIWRSSLPANFSLNDSVSFAEHFALVQHSDELLNMEGAWAGTIIAPHSRVILGQVSKRQFGHVLGWDIEQHQRSRFIRVDLKYNGTPLMEPYYE